MATDSLTFYDNYQTPLAAGAYRFVLQQTVKIEGEGARHYYRDQPFEVQAPRYSIDGSELQARFPPAGGVADYQNALPHLVLRTRSLPWERKLWTESGGEPWLVLLMLSERDLVEGQVMAKTGTVADLVPKHKDAAYWSRAEGDASVLLPMPKAERTEDPRTAVQLLDVDLKLFFKLCPRRPELPLLAHLRRVDTADKVPSEMVADGDFAVLVANRFPQAGANTIHLISLEGWENLIDAGAGRTYPASRVRLITLANWTFVCDGAGHDTFGGLMQGLRERAAVFGPRLPVPAEDDYVKRALAHGYVPVDYQPLDSTPTLAWYRGPFAPVARRRLKQPPYARADAALIFDPDCGIMDVSYAAAWQLGRLLALSSPAFMKGLRLFIERSQNAAELARRIAQFVTDYRGAFDGGTQGNAPPVAEEVAIADELIEWIARLVMLYPVPFHYLVPHPSLLPMESLHFFYVDDNWIDALVDGALSLAVRSLAGKDIAAREDLQATLSKIVYQHRLRLQGKHPEWSPSQSYMAEPKTGFLLRSSLVTGWPGVEITATTSATSDRVIPEILRLDQIADGVLFCLARGSLKQVTFREPREGITFGVNTDGEVEARKTKERFNVKPKMLRADGGDGVIDIAALGDKLGKAGPAQFALQMLRMPEEMSIEWR